MEISLVTNDFYLKILGYWSPFFSVRFFFWKTNKKKRKIKKMKDTNLNQRWVSPVLRGLKPCLKMMLRSWSLGSSFCVTWVSIGCCCDIILQLCPATFVYSLRITDSVVPHSCADLAAASWLLILDVGFTSSTIPFTEGELFLFICSFKMFLILQILSRHWSVICSEGTQLIYKLQI